MLSNTCKYAIRAVVYLAANVKKNERIGIKKISEDLEIPTPFLGKILQLLAKHKVIGSTKGPNGGFGVGKSPENIYVIDIVKIIDGDDIFNQCIISLNECENEGHYCPMHTTYSSIREQIKTLFGNQSIADLVDNYRKDQKVYL